MSDQETVRLIHNTKVKELLNEARRAERDIKVEGDYFIVHDKKSSIVLFRGIKIRSNLWGLTFTSTK